MGASIRTGANIIKKENEMSGKTERRRLRITGKLYADMMNKKANGEATLRLRREIFRLARGRDILGIALILSAVAIIILSFLLYRHW
jgi:hypothetical protein